MTRLVLLVVGLAALLVAQFAYYAVLYRGERRQAELKRRLQTLGGAPPEGAGSVLRERRLARRPLVARVVGLVPGAPALERLLLATELPWTVATVLTLTVLLGAATGVGLWLATARLLVAVPSALVVAVIPLVMVLDARSRRTRKLSSQLPDALDMMVRSLRAGHGLTAALRLCAEEMPLPVAWELGRCFEEQRLGVGPKEAMRNLALRNPDNVDLKIFAVSVIVQHDTGGNLVEVLEQIAETIRDRFRFYGKLRALTVEAKLSGIVLSVLPFVCVAVVAIVRPGYLRPLVEDPIGRALLAGGLGLWIVGTVAMKRLAQVVF